MAKFAPNLRWLFTELPLAERFAAAATAGFDAVEFSPHFDYTPRELARVARENGLSIVASLTPLHWDKGERGNASIPGREADARASADLALEFAAEVGIPLVHPPAGEVPDGVDPERCREMYVENLAYIADRAKPLGVTIVFEPVCRARFPKFLLHRFDEGAEIIRRTGRDNVKLVFDTYHVHMEEGGLTGKIEQYWPLIGHAQIGNPPGRHEPGAGELDLDYFIGLFDAKGYRGHIGLEYTPSNKNTAASLAWTRRYGVAPK
jgi:2-dehydrotetronate isomerase